MSGPTHGQWESNCIPKSKVLRFDGVAARNLNQLESNGVKKHCPAKRANRELKDCAVSYPK
jgi:hypothetical protein